MHFIELSILSPQKCNLVLSVILKNKKNWKKLILWRKIAFNFRHFTIFLLGDLISKKKHTPNNNAILIVNSRYELLNKTRHKLYNLCLVLFNNSYLEFTRSHYYSEYVFSYIS